MAHDIMSQFYAILNLPLQEKLSELTRLIDQSTPNKDLQTLFPQLINNIFGFTFSTSWGLRSITLDHNRHEYEFLIGFLEPEGPLFRLIYKLLLDPQLKYNFPVNMLPLDLQISLEKGRWPQFYSDMLNMDSQSLNVTTLALNPFDYYMMNFGLHLLNNSQGTSSWESWNSVYFALACDYLMHFLPSNPNSPVLPHIPNYTGKVPMAAPLQTANRPLHSSLLLIPDVIGINNQHASPQVQSRNEIWRSETVLQIFIDLWLSVETFGVNIEFYQRNYPMIVSSPERVRIVRVLIKHLHSYSAKHVTDPAIRSSALRKYARQIMCSRAYHYIKHLVATWPLDASFRLVMELWLSFIQPWRYIDNTINQDRFPNAQNLQEEGNNRSFDASFMQFIAENFPSYTCIFQLVVQRFMRLDLTSYKNAVMLFRLGKVFSQPQLVTILRDLEQAITDNSSESYPNGMDMSYNQSFDSSYTHNIVPLHKWVSIAKQAISELNLSANFVYEPIWNNDKTVAVKFVSKLATTKLMSEKILEQQSKQLNLINRGLWASVKHWLMIEQEDELSMEECRKVPNYLNSAIHYFSNIFELSENSLIALDPITDDNCMDHSSFTNSSNFPVMITQKLRGASAEVHYMGDPDLMPIASYESTILVRILHQIASRINELYKEEFSRFWQRNDFVGYMAREVLQEPYTIRTYVKDVTSHQNIVSQNLPARLSLRRLGSLAFVMWLTIGYFVFKMFSYNGFFYIFTLLMLWITSCVIKAFLKMFNILK